MPELDHDALSMQLVTLPQASERTGRPDGYFRQRVSRFRGHEIEELRPPRPIAKLGGADVYQLGQLLEWDERRKLHDQAKRDQWAAERAAKTNTNEGADDDAVR